MASVVQTQPIRRYGRLGKWVNGLLADLKAVEGKKQLGNSLPTMTLAVCIDGVKKYVDVYIAAGPRDTE